MLIRQPSGQHRAHRRTEPPVVRRGAVSPSAVGGTVWALLAVAATAAAFGGMFGSGGPIRASAHTMPQTTHKKSPPLAPAGSGTGQRVVFDQSEQRVWLVSADDEVRRTYLVTGSNRGNVAPGTYSVESRTRFARTYKGGGTFQYFVRFTRGRTAPIGFHTLTVRTDGSLAHTSAELGTPHTPGCVEQLPEDAEALWNFAPIGTPVVVKA